MLQGGTKRQPSSLIGQFRWRFGLVFSILLLVILTSRVITTLTTNYLDTINTQQLALNKDVDILLDAMINQETGVRGYVATANSIFLEPFSQGQQDYKTTLPALQSLLQTGAFSDCQRQLTQVNIRAQTWYTSFALIQIRLIQSHNFVTPRREQTAAQGKALFDRFRQSVAHLQLLLDQHNAAQRVVSYRLNLGSFVFTTLLILLLFALCWFIFSRSLAETKQQLLVLQTTALKLVQGDLHARATSLRHEEFTQVGQAFNSMVDTLLQQQEALADSERKFRILADVIPHMLCTMTASGSMKYCNQRWLDYSGLTLAQSQSWMSLVHPEDQQQCNALWQHTLTAKEPFETEYRLRHASDGVYRRHMVRVLPMRIQQTHLWFATYTDIEERRQMRILIEVNQRLRIFISTVSHEFRTSLTSILGFSELLRDENLEPTESKDYANDIYEESLRLHRMIDDVLDLEKMYEGRLTLHKEEVDCNTLLRETVARVQASSAHHTLRCQLDEHIPPLEADRDKLIQVMTNLLSNAIKYSPDGGDILVSSKREGDMLHVAVQDSGIGIPAEALEQIFIPYHRGGVETNHHIRGTGLGLPIVRQIVMLHGGSVWVESAVKQGSTFHFTLPLTPVVALHEEKATTH